METGPRVLVTPRKKMPLTIPQGMTPVEFYNSAANLKNLARENGLLRTPEDFLLYRKLLGHSIEFDTSIILDTSQRILNPLGRPVRRDQLTHQEKRVWSRMTQLILEDMLMRYPDPGQHVILCGEASLDATWPLSKPGVPSIRMIHNHFICFPVTDLAAARMARVDDPNLTDSGHHSLFLSRLSAVYVRFLEALDLKQLRPVVTREARLSLTGYPKGLPSWEVVDGVAALGRPAFWAEYDRVLMGFLDFYRTFFSQVSSRGAEAVAELHFPDHVENILLFSNDFHKGVLEVRNRILADPQFANEVRWQPAYKQILYRDDRGRLIVTISQNSVGNAITELLGIVVERKEDEAAYRAAEPGLIGRLLEVRRKLMEADLGSPISAPNWPEDTFVPDPVSVQ
ncbi:MAG: hypothetical protein HQL56_00125 [Magnetococcales bacterium]|nr:hypothetical protein [Magnetococcales bacterium]